MPTVINTNLASLFAQNSLSNAQNNLAQSVQRLSSGLRINSAKDDAAGLSISQSMQSQINGTNQSIRNLSDATNLLQVADSSLSTVQDMLLRMKQLTTQGYDGALSASQKLNIMQELIDLNNEINATAQRTQFNGINLLTSGASLDSVNTDVKQGATLVNSAVKVSTASGLGAFTTLADAGNTIYDIRLDDAKSSKTPGSYTLSASGNNLTLTGSFGGKDQSQTIALASMVGYDPSVTQQAKGINTTVNFDNFGISINLTSSIAAGTTETGAQLASAIVARSNTIQVDGKTGQISNVSLRGANPGTYQLSFENTGSVSNLSLPASTVSGQVVAGTARNVALVGGSGSGATADVTYNGSGQITGLTVNAAGTGYKAGDVFSTAAISQGTVVAPTISTVDGAGAATESASVTFSNLAAGETMTLAGLTFKAGTTGASASQVAKAFSDLVDSATTGAGTQVANGSGSYSGVFNGWTTGHANGNQVTFTSSTGNRDVNDLMVGAGSAQPIIAVSQGANNVTEQAAATFKALNAGDSFVFGGLTFKAGTTALTADQVARAFMGLTSGVSFTNANASNADRVAAGAPAVALTANTTGEFTSGTFAAYSSAGATRTSLNATNDTLVFTAASSNADVATLVNTGAPTITTTNGGAGGATESATVAFGAGGLAAGTTVNVGGLMFTAGAAPVSVSQLAQAFQNLSNGATTGAGTAYGTYTGQLNGWNTGVAGGVTGNTVTFTSATSTSNVDDLTQLSAATPPTITRTTVGSLSATEIDTANFSAMGANTTLTIAGLTFTVGINGATATQAAAAFANIQNGTTGAQLNSANHSVFGTFTGAMSGFSTGGVSGVNNTITTFTSSSANTVVSPIAAATVGNTPTISVVNGAAGSTEVTSATFQALAEGQSMTLGGLTFTAGTGGATADNVARAFSGLQTGAVPTTLAAQTQVSRVSFTDLAANATLTVAGRTITANAVTGATAADIATAFATGTTTGGAAVSNALAAYTAARTTGSLTSVDFTSTTANTAVADISVAGTGATSASVVTANGNAGGSYVVGTAFTGWNASVQAFGSTSLSFTPTVAGRDVTDLSSNLPKAPTINVTPGATSATESAIVAFGTLAAGRSITLAGQTFTAGALDVSGSNLAIVFQNNRPNGAVTVAGNELGVMTGALTGYTTAGAAVGNTLQYTSTAKAQTEVASVQFTDMANTNTFTLNGVTVAAGANGITADNLARIFAAQTTAGAAAVAATSRTQISQITAGALAAGDTLIIDGVTITAAVGGATALEVATALRTGATSGAAGFGGARSGNYAYSAVSGDPLSVALTATGGANIDKRLAAVANTGTGAVTINTQFGMAAGDATVTGTIGSAFSVGSVVGRTEKASQTFSAITNGQTVTLNGLTWTAGANGTTAAELASAFASISSGTAFGSLSNRNVGGSFTAGTSGAFDSAAVTAGTTDNVVFTATAANSNVTDFAAATGTGTQAARVTTQGQSVFGSSVLNFTSTTPTANVDNLVATGTAGIVAATTITTTAGSAGANLTDLAAPVSGQAPVIVTIQQGGSTNSTETASVTFNAANMVAGDSVTLAGLTFTAGANGATRAQVAAAFSGLAAGTSSANLSSANGTFSGTLTGWSTGASNGSGLTATSSTASQNVQNLTASATQRSALNALSGIVVGGLANQTGENLLTLRGTVNGNLETSQIKLKDNAANSSQILDFSKFGIQFTVDSFQAQSASDIGAALASLNSSSPSYGTSGAFKPGQIVVGQGANSALKFQSGADSEAFIQIDTLNIQTGKTGATAGSDATMMAVGDAIAGTATGNLGGLGVNDSINSWQTAFRNASAAVDAAIDNISSKRATFGSQMSRLGFITTNLTAQSTNLQNSRSAIIDTDFASETAKLTKGQIMQQAATAMLAQANQMPNVILSLLK